MGNCMETCGQMQQQEEDQMQQMQKQKGDEIRFEKEGGNSSGKLRVKIVLTKEELEMLMHQPKEGRRA